MGRIMTGCDGVERAAIDIVNQRPYAQQLPKRGTVGDSTGEHKFALHPHTTRLLEGPGLFSKNSGLASRVAVYGLPVIGILLIAAAVLNLWSYPRSWAPSIFCVVWGMFLLLWRRFALSRSFAKAKGLQQAFDVEISDDGVELSNRNGKTLSRWPAIEKFVESDDLFLLFCGQRTFHAIPKRAFAAGDADRFRELLSQKVPAER